LIHLNPKLTLNYTNLRTNFWVMFEMKVIECFNRSHVAAIFFNNDSVILASTKKRNHLLLFITKSQLGHSIHIKQAFDNMDAYFGNFLVTTYFDNFDSKYS
jgi:hypothetical protein